MEEAFELVREMGCTEADFLRWLPGATRNASVTSVVFDGGSSHLIETGRGTVDIRLRPLPPRRLGGISLPVLEARFRFIGLGENDIRAFIDWFDHYTRRGGG